MELRRFVASAAFVDGGGKRGGSGMAFALSLVLSLKAIPFGGDVVCTLLLSSSFVLE
jgi:hypothetical protein